MSRVGILFGLTLCGLSVAALISGYADLYRRDPDAPESEARQRSQGVKADICAGWASDATMILEIERVGRIPTPIGPEAPGLEMASDDLAWHPIPSLAPGAMRRRRRIDVGEAARGGFLAIEAMFRDTHVAPDGRETVVHEYSLVATADPTTGRVETCEATPRVLPWTECPRAATSGRRLEGQRLDTLRTFVRHELVGTSTCTHLNDLLRSLSDVPALARHLPGSVDADATAWA